MLTGSGAAPGIEASTPQSRRNQFALRSWRVCTAAAEYCVEPGRRHKNYYITQKQRSIKIPAINIL